MNNIIEIFSYPLLINEYKGSLVEEITFLNSIEYEINGDNSYKSKDTYILNNINLSKINGFINNALKEYQNILKANQKFYITQSWLNKNPINSKHPEHIHPNSFISGVFYFRLNEKHPPIQFSKTQFDMLKLSYSEWNKYNCEVFTPNISTGSLILFPSSLRHSVSLNTSNDVRVSLSFNTFIKDKLGSKEDLTEVIL
tara:strand:- start:47 stop:640 length:594 start_codon:yes stop_codon:yes gene_type:complete